MCTMDYKNRYKFFWPYEAQRCHFQGFFSSNLVMRETCFLFLKKILIIIEFVADTNVNNFADLKRFLKTNKQSCVALDKINYCPDTTKL